jgi:hypothetical protein
MEMNWTLVIIGIITITLAIGIWLSVVDVTDWEKFLSCDGANPPSYCSGL